MPTELEELVEFLHHGNTQIRQIAAENLVGYSTAQPNLFKYNQLEPIKDLKLLVKDYTPIAKNALSILVNVSEDSEVLESLATDDVFLESLLRRVTDAKEPNANLHCMLLANLAKSPSITRLLTLQRAVPTPLSTSPLAIDQLLDCFVKGAAGTYNPAADYDYLCYLFADLAKHEAGRRHFLAPRREGAAAEPVVPLSKLIVFTEHASTIRRRGVANTIKNVCFDLASHAALLADDGAALDVEVGAEAAAPADEAAAPSLSAGIGLLPYVLLPLMGDETYSDEDADGLPEACQLLPPDKAREPQADIIGTHLESLLLLSTERAGRDRLRAAKVYPVVRELHVQVEDDGVREGCDRLVQVLMRGEEGDEEEEVPRVQEVVEDDEDEQVVEVL